MRKKCRRCGEPFNCTGSCYECKEGTPSCLCPDCWLKEGHKIVCECLLVLQPEPRERVKFD